LIKKNQPRGGFFDSLNETRLFCEYKIFGTKFGTKNKMTNKKPDISGFLLNYWMPPAWICKKSLY